MINISIRSLLTVLFVLELFSCTTPNTKNKTEESISESDSFALQQPDFVANEIWLSENLETDDGTPVETEEVYYIHEKKRASNNVLLTSGRGTYTMTFSHYENVT